MLRHISHPCRTPFLALSLLGCGATESSTNPADGGDNLSGDGDGDASPTGDGGSGSTSGAGGVSSEDGFSGCFESFGLDPNLVIVELSEEQKETVCSIQEAMFSCLNPEEQLIIYEAAVLTMATDDPVAACHERVASLLAGEFPLFVTFECHVSALSGCPGTIGELEICYRDYVQQIEDRPFPEWSCENGVEVVMWSLAQVTDLPESCQAFDGCTL